MIQVVLLLTLLVGVTNPRPVPLLCDKIGQINGATRIAGCLNSTEYIPPAFAKMYGPKRRRTEPLVDVIISELSMDAGLSKKVFIELEVFKKGTGRPKSNFLEGFFLLVLNSKPLSVVMSVNLGNTAHKINSLQRFVVVGSSNVDNVKIDINSKEVYSVYKNTVGDDLFPKGDDGPIAVVIVYQHEKHKDSEFYLFKSPQGKQLPILLENDEEKRHLIKTLTKDVVLIGRKAPIQTCDYFLTLFPENVDSPKYLLRDWEPTGSVIDHSLNRCVENQLAFQFRHFRQGEPSPGDKNFCSGLLLHFEDVIDDISPYNSNVVENTPIAGCSAQIPNIPTSRYKAITEQSYKSILERYSKSPLYHCPYKPAPAPAISETELTPTIPTVFSPLSKHSFNVEWLQQCKTYLPNQGRALGIQSIMRWVDIEVTDTDCRFSCYFCKTFFTDGFRPDFKHKENLQRSVGYFSKVPGRIQEKLVNHGENEIHKRAFKYVTKLERATSNDEMVKIYELEEATDIELFVPTMNTIKFIYTEIQSDVSFLKHNLFMTALSKLGLNIGHIHQSEKTPKDVLKVFSDGFQKRLLKFLVTKSPYFSLILDATTYRNIPYLVVLLQTTQEYKPVVFLYCLIPLQNEKGEVMVDSLISQIKKDDVIQPGFQNYFKSNIIAQVSDQASSMTGAKNSFYSHLKAYIGRAIALNRCSAHRLQTAIKHGMNINTNTEIEIASHSPSKKYFMQFGSINNELYSFYFSRGSKRFAHLSDLAEELGFHAVRLKYWFDIRWAASHKKAMLALHEDYDLLISDLLSISNDPSFDSNARQTSLRLHNKLRDKTFAVALCDILDILLIYEKMSLLFQTQNGLMVSKVQVVQIGLKDLLAQKSKPGKHLQNFLNQCSCDNICAITTCTLSQYDNCNEVLRGGETILQTDDEAIKLSDYRDKLYDSLETEIKKYFPIKVLSAFDLFNPKYLKFQCPTTANIATLCEELTNCYTRLPQLDPNEIMLPIEMLDTVCNFYYLSNTDCSKLKSEWSIVLGSIVSNEFLIDYQHDEVHVFWPLALRQSNIEWNKQSKKIIEYVLSTAYSSAAAERTFSITTSLQYKERSTLSSEHLEMLARVKVNGPFSFDQLDVIYYTKEFLKNHVRSDDETSAGGRKAMSEKYHSQFERGDIF